MKANFLSLSWDGTGRITRVILVISPENMGDDIIIDWVRDNLDKVDIEFISRANEVGTWKYKKKGRQVK